MSESISSTAADGATRLSPESSPGACTPSHLKPVLPPLTMVPSTLPSHRSTEDFPSHRPSPDSPEVANFRSISENLSTMTNLSNTLEQQKSLKCDPSPGESSAVPANSAHISLLQSIEEQTAQLHLRQLLEAINLNKNHRDTLASLEDDWDRERIRLFRTYLLSKQRSLEQPTSPTSATSATSATLPTSRTSTGAGTRTPSLSSFIPSFLQLNPLNPELDFCNANTIARRDHQAKVKQMMLDQQQEKLTMQLDHHKRRGALEAGIGAETLRRGLARSESEVLMQFGVAPIEEKDKQEQEEEDEEGEEEEEEEEEIEWDEEREREGFRKCHRRLRETESVESVEEDVELEGKKPVKPLRFAQQQQRWLRERLSGLWK